MSEYSSDSLRIGKLKLKGEKRFEFYLINCSLVLILTLILKINF